MKFKLQSNPVPVYFYKGQFDLFIIGGFFIKANQNFKINIFNNDTNEQIILRKKCINFKFIDGKRALNYFDFKIETQGNYEISIENFDDLIVKKSMLWSKRIFQRAIDLNKIEIMIERK